MRKSLKKRSDLPLILHLETSARKCSVALSKGSSLLTFAERTEKDSYVHAEALHILIESCLNQASLVPADLDAVHVSLGPGSYTGLRIGMSAAKGLAYALGIPLLTTNTLHLLALDTLARHPEAAQVIAMQDAGRLEVYAGACDAQGHQTMAPRALILSRAFFDDLGTHPVILCGDGAHKCASFQLPETVVILSSVPDARQMPGPGLALYAADQYADSAYAEPLYVKDFEAGKPRNLLAQN